MKNYCEFFLCLCSTLFTSKSNCQAEINFNVPRVLRIVHLMDIYGVYTSMWALAARQGGKRSAFDCNVMSDV